MSKPPTTSSRESSANPSRWRQVANPRFAVAAGCFLVLLGWLIPKAVVPFAQGLHEADHFEYAVVVYSLGFPTAGLGFLLASLGGIWGLKSRGAGNKLAGAVGSLVSVVGLCLLGLMVFVVWALGTGGRY